VRADGGVPLGVGAGTVIKNCIVDKNARIGRNVRIENKDGVEVSSRGTGGWDWASGCWTLAAGRWFRPRAVCSIGV
jgi:glucose-1-phosphate adenylyltransferase